MKILGIGNALVDILVRLEDETTLEQLGLRRGGMELIDDERQRQIGRLMDSLNPAMATGGSAGNAILALAKMGAEVGFVGRVGDDELGRFFMTKCQERGIDARVIINKGMTGVANTFISPDGERTFATHLGEAALLDADDITPELFAGYNLLHIEGYLVQNHALILKAASVAKTLGMRISIDLASYDVVRSDLAFFRQLVSEYVDIVFANEEESAAFTEGKSPDEALREIASMCEVAVVKLGKRGSSAMRGGEAKLDDEAKRGGETLRGNEAPNEPCYAPGVTSNVLDTTAAGDFFAGGFLLGFSKGWALEECLSMGALLASRVIRVIGTQVSEKTWEELRESASHRSSLKGKEA